MVERVVIEIVGDASKINETIVQLEKLGKVDKQNSDNFKKHNEAIKTQYQQVSEKLAKVKADMQELLITGARVPEKMQKEYERLSRSISNVDSAFISAKDSSAKFSKDASKDIGYLNEQIQSIKSSIVGAFAVTALVEFGKESLRTASKMDSIGRSARAIFGSTKEAGKAIDFVRNLSEELGLELVSTSESFKLFAGSSLKSGMSLEQTKQIFTSTAKAVTTMGLSADAAEGAFLALSQISSKGVLSMEELRQQLGERIPGVLEVTARKMGMTTMEFNKMVESGKLLSKDVLPKIGEALEEIGAGSENAANGMQANINRLENMWTDFKTFLGAKIIYPIVDFFKVAFVDVPRNLINDLGSLFKKKDIFDLPAIKAQVDAVDAQFIKLEVRVKNAKTRKDLEQLGSVATKYFQGLTGPLKEVFNEKYLSIFDKIGEKYSTLQKKVTGAIEEDTRATDANTKAKEKQLTEFEKLTESASNLEKQLRDLYASGQVANTPLEIKLRTVLSQIDMINEKVDQAKNGLDKMQTTSGSEQGGTGKAFTEAITAFGKPSENKLATEDIIKNAEAANKEFDKIEEERTRKFQEEAAKRAEIEINTQMAAFNASMQIITMGVDFAANMKNQELQYEASLLDEALKNRKISEEEYYARQKQLKQQQAENDKEAAIFKATIDTAQAVVAAWAEGGPAAVELAALAAIVGATQIALIAATPIPQYAEGTDFVKLGKNKKGKDTIHAMLNEGEAVIKTDENLKYPGMAKAWNEGRLDEHIFNKWVLPEMIMHKSTDGLKEKSFAENIAKSIQLNQDFGGLENRLKRLENTEKEVGQMIVGAIEKSKQANIW
jgi:tape measure domain-containing protein